MPPNPNPNRSPLLPSLSKNPNNSPSKNPNPNFKPKSKIVSSRYLLSPATSSSSSLSSTSSSSTLSLSTPRRYPSPIEKIKKIENFQTPNNAKSRSFSTPKQRNSNVSKFSNQRDFVDFSSNTVEKIEKIQIPNNNAKSRSFSTPKQRDSSNISNRNDFVLNNRDFSLNGVEKRENFQTPQNSKSRSFSTPKQRDINISNKNDFVSNKNDFVLNKNDFVSNTRDFGSNERDLMNRKDLKLTATRSLSVSFQGEAFSLPVSKTRVPANAGVFRRGTPASGRWPARNRKVIPNLEIPKMNSFDSVIGDDSNLKSNCNVDGSNGELSENFGFERNGDKSGIFEENDKLGICENEKFGAKFDEKLGVGVNGKFSVESNEKLGIMDMNDNSMFSKSSRRYTTDSNSSDSDSVSSGSTNSCRNANSTKFWQLPKHPSKIMVPPKFGQPKKFPIENFSTPNASQRTISSPMRNSIRTSSPNRAIRGSIDRGMASPSRVRSLISSGFVEMPSVLSFAVDVKRGRVGENQISDAHNLRLLYNRHLQWRFVNARKEAVLLAQRRSVEKNMWNAWVTISKLRESVTRKTYRLHLLKQKLKLASILKGQITYLEDWDSLDEDHCMSLLGSIEALKGSTLRLPVVGGAIVNLQSIEDAIGSAVDVMQAMASSICSVLSKVEEMNSLASELAKEIEKEKVLLAQCKADFTKMAALQVKYCSLRTHILQDNCTYH